MHLTVRAGGNAVLTACADLGVNQYDTIVSLIDCLGGACLRTRRVLTVVAMFRYKQKAWVRELSTRVAGLDLNPID